MARIVASRAGCPIADGFSAQNAGKGGPSNKEGSRALLLCDESLRQLLILCLLSLAKWSLTDFSSDDHSGSGFAVRCFLG